MDGTDAEVIEKIKTDWTERIDNNVEMGAINEEKKAIIDRYEKVLNLLKGVHMESKESLDYIKKPLDELESNLKYIPNGPFFNDALPNEIKDNVLSYICESKAFIVASVCQEWKQILEKRFKDKEVVIGEKCSKCEREDKDCENPTDMMKAAAVHKLDVTLIVHEPFYDEDTKLLSEPVIEVDCKLIADGLTSVSKFTIINDIANTCEIGVQILSDDQFEHLFESIDKGEKILEEVKLVQFDLKNINQDRLANCLVNKIKKLTLDERYSELMLNVETFSAKLQHHSANMKLTHLTLHWFNFSEDSGLSSSNLAKSLCNVENVKLCNMILNKSPIIEPLLENILQMPVMIKTLIIDYEGMDYDTEEGDLYEFKSISTHVLKTIFTKMENLQLEGYFSLKQLEAVRSIPDVEVSSKKFNNGKIFNSIKNGSSEMFNFSRMDD